jgi:hypothetical protein
LLSTVGPERLISSTKTTGTNQAPGSSSRTSKFRTVIGSGSRASEIQANLKQGKGKKPAPLPVTLHARRNLEGWYYADSKYIPLNWPVLCSNPDCREMKCKEMRNDSSYHWELDWKTESATSITKNR